jgi:phospholipid-binding lipoprotein MlaA
MLQYFLLGFFWLNMTLFNKALERSLLVIGIFVNSLFIPQWTSASTFSGIHFTPKNYFYSNFENSDEKYFINNINNRFSRLSSSDYLSLNKYKNSNQNFFGDDHYNKFPLTYPQLNAPFNTVSVGQTSPIEERNRFIFKRTNKTRHYFAKRVVEDYRSVVLPEIKVRDSEIEEDNNIDPFDDIFGLDPNAEDQSYEEPEDPFAEDNPKLEDPFENHNRAVFSFNNHVFNYFTRHVAHGYKSVIPDEMRVAIRNVFDNISMPINLVSSLLQGNIDKSGRVVGRFLINSTVGLGGIFDVADGEFDLKPVNENMTQALGYHGVPSGPYIVIPFMGSSSVRNLVGRTADIFLNPAFLLSAPVLVNASLAGAKKVNETSFLVKIKKELDERSIDEYESVRDFYEQYHNHLIRE